MITLNYDITSGVAKFAATTVIKRYGDVPCQLVFSAAPGTVSSIKLSLGSDAASPAILAYTDTWTQESDTVWTAQLDATDTRLATYMTGMQSATVDLELIVTIDGEAQYSPNLSLTVQQPIVTGATTSDGGPTYYTEAETDSAIAAAVANQATTNTAQTLSNKTLGASNAVSPAVRMAPHRLVVVGDSLSSAGSQYWPPNFNGTSSGLTGSPNSYNVVYSYTGGSPAYNATGIKPLTSWPEQLIALAGGPAELFDFAYAGRDIRDAVRYQWQEDHLLAPKRTGIPAGIVNYIGINQLDTVAGATVWGYLQGLNAEQRRRGYYPIVNVTMQPVTDTGADYAVGGTFDVNRLAYNTLITGNLAADGVSPAADAVVDINAISGLGATNSGSGSHYVRANSANWYDVTHLSASGNALLAGGVQAALNALPGLAPSNTQAVQSDFPFRLMERSPWAWQRFGVSDHGETGPANPAGDFTDASSGGAPNVGLETYFGNRLWTIKNSATAAQYGMGCASVNGMGKHDAWNGPTLGAKDWGAINWGLPLGLAFTCQADFGAGTPYAHTSWQVTLGKNGHANGLLGAGDYAVGFVLQNTTSGVVSVYVTACDGTTAWVSGSPIVTAPTAAQMNCACWVDGYGNLTAEVNRVRVTYAGKAPKAGIGTGGNSLVAESVTTSPGEADANGRLYFKFIDVFADQ